MAQKNKNVIMATYLGQLTKNARDMFNGFTIYKDSTVKVIEYSKLHPRTARYLVRKKTSTGGSIDIWNNILDFNIIESNIHKANKQ